ncbi:MAG: 4'-phosphopantetheinyl transferase family protein [Candidatus Cyclobacteriaceae bacterium M3_2C_046]
MGKVKIEQINKAAAWILWQIEPDTNADEMLSELYLSEGQFFEYKQITNHQKKVEWLSARIALNQLLQQIGLEPQYLIKNQRGKPFLPSINHHISLAHSYPMSVAIYNTRKAIGIDIELVQPKLLKVKNKFLSLSEQEIVQDDLDKLCIYWCAKESLYKAYGQGKLIFKEHIQIEPASSWSDEGKLTGQILFSQKQLSFQLKYQKVGHFYVCYNY